MGDNLPHIADAMSQMHESSIQESDVCEYLPLNYYMDRNFGVDNNLQSMDIDNDVEIEDGNDEHEQQEDDPIVPYIGKEFSDYKHAYEAYNLYARHRGFGVRITSTRKSRSTDDIITRIYVCSKEGKCISNDVLLRRDTRTGCMARMIVSLNQETKIWVVKKLDDIHNHELSTPSKVGKHRSHRKFHRSKIVKDLVDELDDEGLPPSTISRVINVYSGSQDENITARQCQDHLRIRRRNNLGRERVGVIKHFQDKKATDPSFFFAMELDDDYSLRSVFWADGRAINSYLQFGDVVVFDVTYKTNRFSMPFAPFTGVNHHRQSTLFGCALLADETEAIFVWLFDQWLKCMCGKPLGAIITDQDIAICNAIKRVFPHTRHRFCAWHVDKHLMEHVPLLRSDCNEFYIDYQRWFNSKSISESEALWELLKEKYGLYSNL